MKSIIVSLIVLATSSCDEHDSWHEFYKELSSDHPVRKMMSTTEGSGKVSGSYFLFAGGFSGSYSENQYIVFAWKHSDTYVISKVKLTKCRVKIVPDAEVPTVSFEVDRWGNPIKYFKDDAQLFFDEHLKYMTITVKESDWPASVELPLK